MSNVTPRLRGNQLQVFRRLMELRWRNFQAFAIVINGIEISCA